MSPAWFNALRRAFRTLQQRTDDITAQQAQIASVLASLEDADGNLLDVADAIAGKQDASPALDDLAHLPGTGMVARVLGGYVPWTLAGTANRIVVVDGDGAVAAPTFDISTAYVGQASITTLGTIATGTWHGTAIAAPFGGTGQTVYAVGDILFASSTTALSKLAAGTNGYVLTLAAGVPTWAAGGAGAVPTGTGWRHVTAGVEDAAASTPTSADVGLGSVTNDAQTKAAIVPNTAPAAGQLLVGNAGGTAYAPVTLSGDITITSAGVGTIGAAKVTLAMQVNMPTARLRGRVTAGAGVPEDLTGTQATTLLDVFTSGLKGLVPPSGGGTTTFLRADGTFATLIVGGAGIQPVTDVFAANGTWTPPAGATRCKVIVIGPGGGGGAGRKGAAATARVAGAGGGGGGRSEADFKISDLGASEAITVGTGGTGAAAQTTNSNNGAPGNPGSAASSFGNHLKANPGAGGGGGANGGGGLLALGGTGLTSSGGASLTATTAGGAGVAGGVGGYASGSGGNGSGITGVNGINAGGAGGGAPSFYAGALAGGTGGVGAGGNGGNGNASIPAAVATGGGGGASSITGNAGTGGNGGGYGAGGGGGGAAVDAVGNSGAGGNGSDGYVIVISY